MKSKKILTTAINKWNTIIKTSDSFTENKLIQIQEFKTEDGFQILIQNCYSGQAYSCRGKKPTEEMKELAYDSLLEQCVFSLFLSDSKLGRITKILES